jgi:hypothetical protein
MSTTFAPGKPAVSGLLNAPMKTQLSWLNTATQTKVFAVLFGVSVVLELVIEAMLSTLVKGNTTLQARFWVRYLVGAAVLLLCGAAAYIIVNTMALAGWEKLAWVLAVVPIISIAGAVLSISSANVAIDMTSGHSLFGLMQIMLKNVGKKDSS